MLSKWKYTSIASMVLLGILFLVSETVFVISNGSLKATVFMALMCLPCLVLALSEDKLNIRTQRNRQRSADDEDQLREDLVMKHGMDAKMAESLTKSQLIIHKLEYEHGNKT